MNNIPRNKTLSDIVETGSNANGRWVKYRNGIMEQWGKSTTVTADDIITLPQAFADLNFNVQCSALYPSGSWKGAFPRSSSAFTANTFHVLTTDNGGGVGGITFYWRAIGTWSSCYDAAKPTISIGRGIIESGPGYVKYEDGTMDQWGQASLANNATSTVTFPTAFADTNYYFSITSYSGGGTAGLSGQAQSKAVGSCTVYRTGLAGTPPTTNHDWFARGRWKSATVANGSYTYGQGVVETGSNSNGEYIKFDNGTMICTGERVLARDSTTMVTYPAAFAGSPSAISVRVGQVTTTTNGIVAVCPVNARTLTTFSVYILSAYGTSTETYNFFAIGRWK